uniref:Vacuolar import/degradation Vid27 C-terminal domain-containing protein n=1 Tax=Tetraselmis chuii TaxID=63592 RepID=A0A7S1T8S4_9CHLO
MHGGVEYGGASFHVTPAKGDFVTPSKIMLTHGERYMNMLSPAVHTGVFHTDIETGKVVSEWRFQKDGVDVPMKDIVNDTKNAQLDERDTFLGLDAARLARWDMRDPHGVVQDLSSPAVCSYKTGKDYSGRPRFSCMATSGEGYVVVGSEDGTVRLYNNTDKGLNRASTSFPSLGAPVTNVDVTFDAEWIVATTDNYLMIIKTAYVDSKSGKDTHGFKGRMGKNACAPRLLRLKPEDWQLAGKGAKLEKGKFTWITEQGKQERWIVASCGNFSVLWNFTQVKANRASDTVSHGGLATCTTYNIIPKTENVVDSVFLHEKHAASPGKHAQESSLVVATKNYLWSCAEDDEDSDFE